jgi:hypothetical protein
VLDVRFERWFPYISAENGERYRSPVEDMLAFRYATAAELRAVRTPKDVGRMVRERARFASYRRRDARPLLKDPIAVFSAEWLVDTFDMDAVVLIRHPAAFVDSIVRRGWRHPFADFLAQPLLMRDVLGPFEDEIAWCAERERPLLDQAIVLWRVIHHAIATYRDRRPGWTFARLEDLASDPIPAFERLYAALGQVIDDAARAKIEDFSGGGNEAVASDAASHRRDSRSSVVAWKRSLSPEDVDRIREAVEPISKAFYPDADW